MDCQLVHSRTPSKGASWGLPRKVLGNQVWGPKEICTSFWLLSEVLDLFFWTQTSSFWPISLLTSMFSKLPQTKEYLTTNKIQYKALLGFKINPNWFFLMSVIEQDNILLNMWKAFTWWIYTSVTYCRSCSELKWALRQSNPEKKAAVMTSQLLKFVAHHITGYILGQ